MDSEDSSSESLRDLQVVYTLERALSQGDLTRFPAYVARATTPLTIEGRAQNRRGQAGLFALD